MKECKTCKSIFNPKVIEQSFCCHRCQAQWAIKLANLKKRPRPRKGAELDCATCGKKFYVPQYRLQKKCTKYCSRSCLDKKHLAPYIKEYGFKPLHKPRHTYRCIRVNGKMLREHRYVMEQYLERKLEKWEHVHHINDDSSDNRIENLEVLSNSDHQRKEYLFRKKLTSS